MTEIKNTISYHSTPIDMDLTGTDDFETLTIKANQHNEKIRYSYLDTIKESDKTIYSFAGRVFDYESTQDEYNKLLRQLTQNKAIFITIINQDVDLGCIINDEENHIQAAFDKMTLHLKSKIEILEEYIIVVGQQINNTKHLPELKSGLNLKSQFKNPAKYDEVFSILIANGNLKKDIEGELIYIGSPSPNKYGVEALRLVLKDLDYLKNQSSLTGLQILEIHRNTFKEYSATIRTLNNKNGISKAYTYFLAVLSRK